MNDFGLDINCWEGDADKDNFVEKIKNAYIIYMTSKSFVENVSDDYGKQKIARLRLDFAHHNLLTLLHEAGSKGIVCTNNEIIKKIYCNES